MLKYIDTHAHLDAEEFEENLSQVAEDCKAAGAEKVFIPAIHPRGFERMFDVCSQQPGWAFPMAGLHPEEVNEHYEQDLADTRTALDTHRSQVIAIGEVGLDFYWSRDFCNEQLLVFEEQVRWSVETRLPLMIHCRKAQAEMVKILRRYEHDLPGGVFHCFTGNEQEARELLSFSQFALGIGGVLTFKKSHLPEVLPAAVPLTRIVLETDSPYMAPVPMRGKLNTPAYIPYIITRMSEAYGVSEEEVCRQTTENATRIFLSNN